MIDAGRPEGGLAAETLAAHRGPYKERRVSELMPPSSRGAALAALFLLALAMQPAAVAQQQPSVNGHQPIWMTITASAQGNYPGGTEQFAVFVVNSAQNQAENETIKDMTLVAPFGSSNATGLPVVLLPGESYLTTISLQIPADFSGKAFRASLDAHVEIWNGSAYSPSTLSGTADVDVFSLPSQPSTTNQPAGISLSVVVIAVAVPSIVALALLVLLVRARGRKA